MSKIIDAPPGGWVQGEFYVAIPGAKYKISCPTNRHCKIGVGVVTHDTLVGWQDNFSGEKEIFAPLIGAIYFLVDDALGGCSVTIESIPLF
ncbi:hypothetical protein [Raoultella planticola]|uniref:Uncharacterized protein n=1 Tax=Raoultella planticola TaxID=575 RepID=A0ABU5M4G3_RAOPL|nr:hypothetical protein [Raoultella planticola]MDW4552788.1 hypothetical protein [Raoultella planticola]MDZ7446247.1 hypothetical protein [Raoultella planticola]MDZ7467084.1 hypothetical protein [Raoultella planticola]MDZ7504868.1 hypothetical protein [Raoultella planticola]MEA5394427.1 hypothetical protein [Raoultella planticola]